MNRPEIEPNKNSENRHHGRLELETEVTIRSANGFLPGWTLDISESGMSAILPVELQVGEIVELKIKLPIALATGRAVVRNRNVFRHGFEFLQPLHDVVRHETADPLRFRNSTLTIRKRGDYSFLAPTRFGRNARDGVLHFAVRPSSSAVACPSTATEVSAEMRG